MSDLDRKWYDGFLGIFREPFYMLFGPTSYCPDCPRAEWKGWYATKHMDYCHYCGTELMMYD